MQHVVVSGVSVVSDKRIAAASDEGRIDFADGSWCDVSSGQVFNVGGGMIALACEPATAVSGPALSYQWEIPPAAEVEAVDVGAIYADVVVEVHDLPTIEVAVVGDQRNLDDLEAGVTLGVFSIGPATSSLAAPAQPLVRARLTLTVPAQMPVRVHAAGSIAVGDTGGPLAITGQAASISAGVISDLTVMAGGTTSVAVQSVTGECVLRLSDAARVSVRGGDLRVLDVVAADAARASVSAVADTGRVVAAGAAIVDVLVTGAFDAREVELGQIRNHSE